MAGSKRWVLHSREVYNARPLHRTRHVRAEGFRYSLDVPDQASALRSHSWWRTVLHEAGEAVVNVWRIVWLLLLFTPLALSAPLAFQLNFKRAVRMH
jgi:aarF domain-containing kinase